MDGLNGSFDKTEFDLASAENTTIENAPTDTTAFGISGGAITKDQKIGTITVKITSDTSDTTMVKNLEDLRGAFENGGKAKLNNDHNGAYEMLTLLSGKDLEFDLNRKTLSVESISLSKENLPIRILPDSFKVGVPVVTIGTLSVPNVKSPEMVTSFLTFIVTVIL